MFVGCIAYTLTVVLCLYFTYLGLIGIFAGGWLILGGLLAIAFAAYIWAEVSEVLDDFIRNNNSEDGF